MSGFEVAERLKNDPATQDIPIIMVTALDDDESKMRGLAAGADEFLNKPVNPAELSVRIKSLISLKQYREQLRSHDDTEGYFLEQGIPSNGKGNPPRPPLVLLVENEEGEAIERLLQGEPYTIKRVASGEDAITLASDEEVSVVLLDTFLPDMSGVEVCRRLKEGETTRATQVLFISSLKDLETKAQSMEAGADDFLVKPINQYELRARVKALLSKKSHMDRLNSNGQNDLHAVITDKLTGLYNQAYFTHFTDIEVKRSRRNKQPVILVRVEIDDFKIYKGTLGLWAGDLLMKELGQLMKGNFREIDLIARCDREGFGVLMPYTDLKGASQALDRLREAIKGHLFLRGTALPPQTLTVSMGISGYPWSAATVSELIQNANQALSAAKRDGKNRISVHQSENQQVEKGGSGSQTPFEAPGGTEYH
jgi:two-component system cell cycle response regulator